MKNFNVDVKNISKMAVVADLRIGLWSAESSNKNLSNSIKNRLGKKTYVRHSLLDEKGKNLLSEVKSAAEAIKSFHKYSGPEWKLIDAPEMRGKSNTQIILRIDQLENYYQRIDELTKEFDSRVESFMSYLVTSIEKERATWQGEYPDRDLTQEAERFRDRFYVFIGTQQIPVNEDNQFVGLTPEVEHRLRESEKRQFEMLVNNALKDTLSQLREKAVEFASKMENDRKLRSDYLTGIGEFLENIKGFNILNMPEIDELIGDVREVFSAYNPELHGSEAMVTEVRSKAKKVSERATEIENMFF